MIGYIKSYTGFATTAMLHVTDYELTPDAAEAESSSITVPPTAPLSADNAGDWLLLDGKLWLIDSITGDRERYNLQLSDPVELFERRTLYRGEAASVEAFIAATIDREWVRCPDPEYAAPYITVTTGTTTAFKPPILDDAGLFSLAEYIRVMRAAHGVTVTMQLTAQGIALHIAAETPAARQIVMGDGHHMAESFVYGSSGVSKVSIWKGETENIYYLQDNGSVSQTPPEPRIPGKWQVASIDAEDEDTDMAELAAQTIAKERYGHKIEFASDAAYPLYTPVTIRLDGQLVRSRLTAIRKSSTDTLLHYQAGDLPTSLTDKIKKINTTANDARRGTKGKPVETTTEQIPYSVTVNWLDSIRYVQENRAWRTNREWVYTYGFQTGSSLVGKTKGGYLSATLFLLPPIPLEGHADYLLISLDMSNQNKIETHSYRWALTTERHDAEYQSYGAVAGTDQVATGVFTPKIGGRGRQSFRFDANLPANTPLYLYMWADENRFGNFHIYADTEFSTVDVVERVIT